MEIEEFRFYEGRNIYSYHPVLRMSVNLGEWSEKTSKDIPYFAEKLLCLLPGLEEHHCTRGRKGGFIERLQEGTYLGHVIEHIAIELQGLAGFPVNYGTTRSAGKAGSYHIIFSYHVKEGAFVAANFALELVKALLDEKEFNLQECIKGIQKEVDKNKLGPSTSAIIAAALQRDIPVMPLGIDSLLQLGYGCKQQRVQATITGRTSCIAVDLSCDKMATKSILLQGGVPVPRGEIVRTEEEVMHLFKKLACPLAIKPANGNQGKGVSINLIEEKQVKTAFALAKNYSEQVLLEESLSGKDYRLLVINGKLVAAAERKPPFIKGDGKHSIEKIIEQFNQDPLRGEGHEKPLTKIKIDPALLLILARKNLTLKSIPPRGAIIYLRENGNLSTGGLPIDVLEQVHPFNAWLAVRCASLLGLDIAGIDIVATDISLPLDKNSGGVIEINAAPGIRMHLPPLTNKGNKVGEAIVDGLFPVEENGRIPLIAVTGTNGKTTTTRMIGHVLSNAGKKVGMTTTDGVYLKEKLIYAGDMTGPQGARMILQDPETEIAVLETARGGIIRSGLSYDWSDIAVLTNISSDHLGQDGVENIDDLIYVKALVLETVKDGGYVVLNAEDSYLEKILEYIPRKVKIIYFALSDTNIILKNHLEKGGKAVYLKNNFLTLAMGKDEENILDINKAPFSYAGRALYNIQNSLAATSALYALGLDKEKIKAGLNCFNSDSEQNPGRSNFWELGDFQVLLDYGHNPAGYQAIGKLIKELKPKRAIGIIGMPGDRQDKLILEVGQIAASFFEQLIIKEDEDLRGRRPLEVAELLYQAALNYGLNQEKIQVIPSEKLALQSALEQAQAGDLVVVFYEKLAHLENLLKEKEIIKLQEKENKSEMFLAEKRIKAIF